jgi:hypothetical protein
MIQSEAVASGVDITAVTAVFGGVGLPKDITKLIPIFDTVTVRPALNPRTGHMDQQVVLPKKITQNVDFVLTKGLSDTNDITASLQWKLTPKMKLNLSWDNSNNTTGQTIPNVGLIWSGSFTFK